MAVIGTFGQFTTARLAIYASQASLSVTGNNIANINTDGYTRQRMDLVSLYSTGQGKYANIFNTNVGYGVLTRGATQLRDPYLDIRYRNEAAKLGASDEKYDGLYQIGSILDEVGKGSQGFGVIEGQFNTFLAALEDLNTNTGSEEYDKLVRSAATTLAAYFRKAATDLQDIKVNKANELNEAVSDVNKLLTEIRDLNAQIRTQGIYGSKALELRDARNLALDKLSEYIPIDVTYSMERIDQFSEVEKLTVTIKDSKGPDGRPIKLVDGIYGGQISMPKMMPDLNPNADQKKIVDAMNAKREEAEKNPDWIKERDDEVEKQLAPLRTKIEADNTIDKEPWATKLQKELDKIPADATPEEKAKAEAAANEKIEKERKEFIDEAIKDAKRPIYNAEEKKRQEKIEQAVADERAAQTAIFGKYVANGGTVENGPYTDDWTTDANGMITSGPSYFNMNEEDLIDPDNRYLMRVEQLIDQRGRVMEDNKLPSGKSEVVALGDTTFCGTYAGTGGDGSTTEALGSLQAMREMLTREGEYASEEDINRDPNAVTKRGIPYYEHALDSLAKKFAEVFNGANQLPADTVYTNDGNLFYADADKTIPVKDEDGNDVTLDRVLKRNLAPNATPEEIAAAEKDAAKCLEVLRQKAKKAPGYAFYNGGVLISNRSDNNDPSNITAANISISAAWGNHSVSMLPTTEKSEVLPDGTEVSHSTTRPNIAHMISEFTKKMDYYAKDAQGDAAATLPVYHGSFQEVFTAISGVLADDADVTGGKVENYSITTLDLENNRQSVSGVDLNEEATSMMQFSKSYAAACRLLTTIDSMLDTLINGTAR